MAYRELWVSEERRIEPLGAVYNSRIKMDFKIMDRPIPEQATISIYAKSSYGVVKSKVTPTVANNTITFYTDATLFAPGKNKLQIEIAAGSTLIRSWTIDVLCDDDIASGGSVVPPETVKTYAEQAIAASNTAVTAANSVKDSADKIPSIVEYLPYAKNKDLSDACGKLMSNITTNCVFNADPATGLWTDYPGTSGGVFSSQRYSDNYTQQTYTSYVTGLMYVRYINTSDHTVYGSGWQLVNSRKNWAGKKVSIVGDSVSTFKGLSQNTDPAVSGYASYYPSGNVTNANNTWWMKLINTTGMQLLHNVANSGSTIASGTSTGRVEASAAERIAYIGDGSTSPDVIIVYIGLNDYFQNVPIGDFDGVITASKPFPGINDRGTFMGAYSYFIDQLRRRYPKAIVYLCTLHAASRQGNGMEYVPVDQNANNVPKRAYNEAIRKLADIFACELIEFDRCGIHLGNITDYAVDYNTGTNRFRGLHPNSAGHELMYLEALKHFR